jgi:hypothetical protein
MSIKSIKKKTKNPKTEKLVSSEMVAGVVGCSSSMVRQVRSGDRSQDTDLGQTIMVADILLEEGTNKLIQEVKRIIKIG